MSNGVVTEWIMPASLRAITRRDGLLWVSIGGRLWRNWPGWAVGERIELFRLQ
jgi:hypothetical protein